MPDVTPDGDARFIRTVLLVDDRAFSLIEASEMPVDEDRDDGSAHPVDTKALSDTLADHGISCTVLAPGRTDDDDRKRVVRVAQTADAVVLDWTIGRPPGNEDALPLLRSILEDDLAGGGRLRLIVVYTGNDAPRRIVNDIRDEMIAIGFEKPTVKGYCIVATNVRIHVIGKRKSADDIETMRGEELGAALPGMFDKAFADGLLRRVALAGVVALRAHAHELLTKFPAELDRAFLSHRGMTSPAAAEQYARQLVADEVSALLANAAIEQWVRQAEVEKILTEVLIGDEQRFVLNKTCMALDQKGVSVDEARTVLSETRHKLEKAAGKDWDKIGSLTPLFDPDGMNERTVERARDYDEAFTVLSLFARTHDPRDRGRGSDPHLGLGAVLERGGEFWLCMQPLCDSVLLTQGAQTPFPLLPMKPKSGEQPFDVIVPVGEARVRLRVSVKMRELILPRFVANADRVVSIPLVNGVRPVVPVPDDGKAFAWLGQLRLDHAHRFASFLGHSAARIGLDEPEWSRKRADRS